MVVILRCRWLGEPIAAAAGDNPPEPGPSPRGTGQSPIPVAAPMKGSG